jgi:hypothetical protein
MFSFVIRGKKENALCSMQRTRKSRGTTSVYRSRGLMGSKQTRRLYRAIPVFAYLHFSKATPKGIPRRFSHCLAPTGSSLGDRIARTGFHQRVVYEIVFSSLAPPTP